MLKKNKLFTLLPDYIKENCLHAIQVKSVDYVTRSLNKLDNYRHLKEISVYFFKEMTLRGEVQNLVVGTFVHIYRFTLLSTIKVSA